MRFFVARRVCQGTFVWRLTLLSNQMLFYELDSFPRDLLELRLLEFSTSTYWGTRLDSKRASFADS